MAPRISHHEMKRGVVELLRVTKRGPLWLTQTLSLSLWVADGEGGAALHHPPTHRGASPPSPPPREADPPNHHDDKVVSD